jgi:dTDP-4-amino-4,6-dideoxygalactose transaminase
MQSLFSTASTAGFEEFLTTLGSTLNLLTTFSFIGTAEAINLVGAVPVFVD